MNDATLNIDFKATNKTGKGILRISVGADPIHTRKLDITDHGARLDAVDTVCRARPGIDRDELSAKLEEHAGKVVDDGGDGSDDATERLSQSQALVSLAQDAELWRDGDAPYATVTQDDHHEHHPINGRVFRLWLGGKYYRNFGKAAGAQAMQDAIGALAGKAMFDGATHATAVRLAQADGNVYLDLANDKWQAVEVSASGFRVVDEPPVKFIRRRGMQALPLPVTGGSLDELRPLVNAGDDAAWTLMVSWLVGALCPHGPYSVLVANGEQGSAKSTTSRMLRRLVDPNEADLRAAPKDDRDLMIAARNAWVVALDNLSGITPSLSDALCRLATGGGFATRQLYSDDEECLFHAARPILFNGIEELATRPDLLERAIVLDLPTIADADRVSEADLWLRYEESRPRVLGALLTAVAAALRNRANVKLARRPRMADFATWVTAAEPALPWSAGGFIAAYDDNRGQANDMAVEHAAIGPAVLSLMHSVDRWEGSATELQTTLEDHHADLRTKARVEWPKSPKGMSNALRRLSPALRRAGINVAFPHRTAKSLRLTLERVPAEPSQPSQASSTPLDAPENRDSGSQSMTLGDGTRPSSPPEPSSEDPRQNPENGPCDGCDGSDGTIPALSSDDYDDDERAALSDPETH